MDTPYAANERGVVEVSSIDICLIGDGTRYAPTDAQMEELVRLVQLLQKTYQIRGSEIHLAYSRDNVPIAFPKARLQAQLLSIGR